MARALGVCTLGRIWVWRLRSQILTSGLSGGEKRKRKRGKFVCGSFTNIPGGPGSPLRPGGPEINI